MSNVGYPYFIRIKDKYSRTTGDYTPYELGLAQITASYIIEKYGNIVRAINGQTKEVEFKDEDAATVIRQAINNLPSSGGRIFINVIGELLISSAINITKRVYIHGLGNTVTTLKLADGANCDMFVFKSREAADAFSKIGQLKLDGNKANQTETCNGIVVEANSVADLWLEDLWIDDFNGNGIKIYYGWDILIHGVVIEHCDDYAIRLISTTDVCPIQTWITKSFIQHNNGAIYVGAISNHPNEISIQDNFIGGTPTGNNTLMDIYAHGVKILGNTIAAAPLSANCLKIGGRNILIKNNLFQNTFNPQDTYYDIYIEKIEDIDYYKIAINDNIFASGYPKYTIAIVGGPYSVGGYVRGLTINNNMFSAPSTTAIYLDDGSQVSHPEIINNIFYFLPARRNAIRLGMSYGALVSNNIFYYADTAIDISSLKCMAPVIKNNLFHDCTTPVTPHGNPSYPATIKNNVGYTTENSGTATIPAGSTRVTVNHGLAGMPSKVVVTPLGDPGDRFWVENVTDTSFDIVVATAPAADIQFYWEAEI